MKTAILTTILLISSQFSAAMSPEELLDAVDAVRAPGENFSFSLDVMHIRHKKDPLHFTFTVRVGNSVMSLVRYTAPRSAKGKALLMIDDNMWIYIPGTRRAIRISAQQQLLGQVSNADVARVVYRIDYTPQSITETDFQGTRVRQLNLLARNPGSTYQRIELLVSIADHHPLQAQFFALSGRLLKTVRYEDYQQAANRLRPMRLVVTDEVRQGEQTVMIYSDLRVAHTPESWFQKDYLPRLR